MDLDDGFIQLRLRVLAGISTAKAMAQVDLIGAGVLPAVNTRQPFRLKVVSRFFQSFTHCGFHQAFIRLHMAGRLIVDCLPVVDFFNDEKSSVFFDDGGDGDVQQGIGGSGIHGTLRLG